MSNELIQKAVADYFAATRAMDAARWVATFAEDGVSHDPAAPPARGHEALRLFFESIAGAFREVGLTEDNVFVVGREAAVKWTGRGVGHKGREVVFEGIDIFEIDEAGKIQTVRAYWNPAALMAQLQG
ncbi:MAG TPA: nuclear transport factor 2 family protein [Pyrinomonadaceae bacterium]|jgi:steroid delta-isomerase|nr:nuclear transport factor 2 family protein [Pyrinomonadaceae bacterium]